MPKNRAPLRPRAPLEGSKRASELSTTDRRDRSNVVPTYSKQRFEAALAAASVAPISREIDVLFLRHAQDRSVSAAFYPRRSAEWCDEPKTNTHEGGACLNTGDGRARWTEHEGDSAEDWVQDQHTQGALLPSEDKPTPPGQTPGAAKV